MVVWCDSHHIIIVKVRSKFTINKYDKTAQAQMKLNKVFKKLREKSEVEEEVYNKVRSTEAFTTMHNILYLCSI